MLSFAQPAMLRAELSFGLQQLSTIELSWQLGQRSATPSVAFFIGYQAAMRCLNPKLATDAWAALLVSERGIKSPFAIKTNINLATLRLEGKKSYAMLAGAGLNKAYVMAKVLNSDPTELVLCEVPVAYLQSLPADVQPFMQDIPHHEVHFSVVLSKTAIFATDAHSTINKPFRYWEDVHVLLALAGWMQSQFDVPNNEIAQSVAQLQQCFLASREYYSLSALDAIEGLWQVLQQVGEELKQEAKAQWQQDAKLFFMLQMLWPKVRAKLDVKVVN